jgi:hypothetical protein
MLSCGVGAAPGTRPRSLAFPQVQGLVHAADRDAFEAAARRAQARMSISTEWPAQAATSVAGTPELSRQVIPEWRRS